MHTNEQYTQMQLNIYGSEGICEENHIQHNENPDYWDILLSPLKEGNWSDKKVLDFGCGCGRNVQNILNNFTVKEAHGCDISPPLINACIKTTSEKTNGKENFYFVATDGQSLQPLESNTYDMIISTITLQHICVYSIRRKILEDMFRCLLPGGVISIQMGYGRSSRTTSQYFEDATYASSTNGGHDVRVDDVAQILSDINSIGFTKFHYLIGQPWSDAHSHWIYFKASKPI
jgi:ubiquinone/menaquinone biosynthesis C-methylase UbiE